MNKRKYESLRNIEMDEEIHSALDSILLPINLISLIQEYALPVFAFMPSDMILSNKNQIEPPSSIQSTDIQKYLENHIVFKHLIKIPFNFHEGIYDHKSMLRFFLVDDDLINSCRNFYYGAANDQKMSSLHLFIFVCFRDSPQNSYWYQVKIGAFFYQLWLDCENLPDSSLAKTLDLLCQLFFYSGQHSDIDMEMLLNGLLIVALFQSLDKFTIWRKHGRRRISEPRQKLGIFILAKERKSERDGKLFLVTPFLFQDAIRCRTKWLNNLIQEKEEKNKVIMKEFIQYSEAFTIDPRKMMAYFYIGFLEGDEVFNMENITRARNLLISILAF
jgi:hypothetical protein